MREAAGIWITILSLCAVPGLAGADVEIDDLPQPQVSFGASVRALGDHGVSVTDANWRDVAYARVGPSRSEVSGPSGEAITFDLRTSWDVARFLYTGIDLGAGAARVDDPRQELALGVRLGERAGMYCSGGAVAGVVLIAGPIVVRGEVLGGLRFMEIPYERDGSGMATRTAVTQGFIEPRAGVEIWLTPWVTLGGRAGSDLFRRNDYVLGAYLAFYGRAYNGSRQVEAR